MSEQAQSSPFYIQDMTFCLRQCACMQAEFSKTHIYNYIHIHVVNVRAGTIFQESLDLPDEGIGPALCSSPPGKSSQ